jgi:hypothetical protein
LITRFFTMQVYQTSFFIQVLHTSCTYKFLIQVSCTSFPYKLFKINFYSYGKHFLAHFRTLKEKCNIGCTLSVWVCVCACLCVYVCVCVCVCMDSPSFHKLPDHILLCFWSHSKALIKNRVKFKNHGDPR